MKFGFSFIGLIIFVVPMLINIIYFMFPEKNPKEEKSEKNNKILEGIEQTSRVLFAILICILVSNSEIKYRSCLLYISITFLVLYYIVWIRYFINGRDVKMLGKRFFFIPMPLAIFPVLYFLFSALWIKNYPAAVVMVIFGIAHNLISYKNLYIKSK